MSLRLVDPDELAQSFGLDRSPVFEFASAYAAGLVNGYCRRVWTELDPPPYEVGSIAFAVAVRIARASMEPAMAGGGGGGGAGGGAEGTADGGGAGAPSASPASPAPRHGFGGLLLIELTVLNRWRRRTA